MADFPAIVTRNKKDFPLMVMSNAGAVYGHLSALSSGARASLTPPVSPVAAAIRTLTETEALCDRLASIIDRLVGSAPTQGETLLPASNHTGDGIFQSLDAHAAGASACIRRAQNALDRLERALP